MIDIARYSAGAVFFTLLVATLLTLIDWRFVAVAWPLLLGWYLVIRWTFAESKELLRHPLFVVLAAASLVTVPILAVFGVIIGDPAFRKFAETNEPYIAPIIVVALIFVVYSVWTGAKALVISEEKDASDRALRWEKTTKTFLEMYFWPIGVWSVQKRIQAARR